MGLTRFFRLPHHNGPQSKSDIRLTKLKFFFPYPIKRTNDKFDSLSDIAADVYPPTSSFPITKTSWPAWWLLLAALLKAAHFSSCHRIKATGAQLSSIHSGNIICHYLANFKISTCTFLTDLPKENLHRFRRKEPGLIKMQLRKRKMRPETAFRLLINRISYFHRQPSVRRSFVVRTKLPCGLSTIDNH